MATRDDEMERKRGGRTKKRARGGRTEASMKGTEVALQNPKEQVDRDAKERGDSFRKGGHVQRKRRASGGALSEAHTLKAREGGGETHQGGLRRGGRATGRKK